MYSQEVNGSLIWCMPLHLHTTFAKIFFLISIEKHLRSTQENGGDDNAQTKYLILFPDMIQNMV